MEVLVDVTLRTLKCSLTSYVLGGLELHDVPRNCAILSGSPVVTRESCWSWETVLNLNILTLPRQLGSTARVVVITLALIPNRKLKGAWLSPI